MKKTFGGTADGNGTRGTGPRGRAEFSVFSPLKRWGRHHSHSAYLCKCKEKRAALQSWLEMEFGTSFLGSDFTQSEVAIGTAL